MTYNLCEIINKKLNLTGTNSDNQKNSMTVHVTMDYESKDSENIVKNSSWEMSMIFCSLPEFNENTPKPTGENIFIKEKPELIVVASHNCVCIRYKCRNLIVFCFSSI
jgi:hypothetical protein